MSELSEAIVENTTELLLPENLNETTRDLIKPWKFGLYLGKGLWENREVVPYEELDPIYETLIDSQVYSKGVRYDMNVRSITGSLMNQLLKVLSSEWVETEETYGDTTYDSLFSYRENLNQTNDMYRGTSSSARIWDEDTKLLIPEEESENILGRIHNGVRITFGLYTETAEGEIKPIIQRHAYVRHYNPESRFSGEIKDVVDNYIDEVKEKARGEDILRTFLIKEIYEKGIEIPMGVLNMKSRKELNEILGITTQKSVDRIIESSKSGG